MAPLYAVARPRTRRDSVLGGGDHEILPDGEYGLVEFFCNDPECVCRRVILQVETNEPVQRVWASIHYGWERPSYYAPTRCGFADTTGSSKPRCVPEGTRASVAGNDPVPPDTWLAGAS